MRDLFRLIKMAMHVFNSCFPPSHGGTGRCPRCLATILRWRDEPRGYGRRRHFTPVKSGGAMNGHPALCHSRCRWSRLPGPSMIGALS